MRMIRRKLARLNLLLFFGICFCMFVCGEVTDVVQQQETSAPELSEAGESSQSSEEESLPSFFEKHYSELRSLYSKALELDYGYSTEGVPSLPQWEAEWRKFIFELARLEREMKRSEAAGAAKETEGEDTGLLAVGDLRASITMYKQYLEALIAARLRGGDWEAEVYDAGYRYSNSVSKIYRKLGRSTPQLGFYGNRDGPEMEDRVEDENVEVEEEEEIVEEEQGTNNPNDGDEEDAAASDEDYSTGFGFPEGDLGTTEDRTGDVTTRLRQAQDMLYGPKSKRNVTEALIILKEIAALVPSTGHPSTPSWRPPYYPDDEPESSQGNDSMANGIATPGGSSHSVDGQSPGAAVAAAQQGGEEVGLQSSGEGSGGSGALGGEAGVTGKVWEAGMSPVSSTGPPPENSGPPGEMPEPWGGVPGLTYLAGTPPAADTPPEAPPSAPAPDRRSSLVDMAASDARFFLAVLSSMGIVEDRPLNDTEAVMELKRSSELGSIPSMLALASRHFHGRGVRKSCDTAFWYLSTAAQELLLQADKEGDHHLPPEPLRLRESFRSASYVQNLVNEDHADFVDLDEDLAMHGVPQAQRRMGFRQLLGRGLDRDPDAAFRHFQAAAAGGDHVAAFNLGYMYMRGISVPTNYTAARKLFTAAALRNFPAAFNGLGVLHFNGWGVPLDYDEARRYFEMGAMPPHNNTDSLYNLASMYQMGYGVEPNATTAFRYLDQAAMNDHWRAPHSLALMHFQGTGTPRNCSHAVRLMALFVAERRVRSVDLEEAASAFESGDHWSALVRYGILAEQGSTVAVENVAFMLRRGYGYKGPGRHDLALSMCLRSAAAGNLYSYIDAGDLHFERLVSNASDAKVVEYYEKAAVAQDPEALYSLAYLHQHGSRGVPQNFSRAEELLEAALAAAKGEAAAAPVLVAMWWLYAHWVLAEGAKGVQGVAVFLNQLMRLEIEENHVCLLLGVLLALVCYQLWARSAARRSVRQHGRGAGAEEAEGRARDIEVVDGNDVVNGINVGAVDLSEQPGTSARGVPAEAREENVGEIVHTREGVSGGEISREGDGGHAQELRRRILRTS